MGNTVNNSNAYLNLDDLEMQLSAILEDNLDELKALNLEQMTLTDTSNLEETIINVVWDEFINQLGKVAGDDFIKENRGLTLNLKSSAHVLNAEDFNNHKLPQHNPKIGEYEERYQT